MAWIDRKLHQGLHGPDASAASADVHDVLAVDAVALSLTNTGIRDEWALRQVLRRTHVQAIMVDVPRDFRLVPLQRMEDAYTSMFLELATPTRRSREAVR